MIPHVSIDCHCCSCVAARPLSVPASRREGDPSPDPMVSCKDRPCHFPGGGGARCTATGVPDWSCDASERLRLGNVSTQGCGHRSEETGCRKIGLALVTVSKDVNFFEHGKILRQDHPSQSAQRSQTGCSTISRGVDPVWIAGSVDLTLVTADVGSGGLCAEAGGCRRSTGAAAVEVAVVEVAVSGRRTGRF